MGSFVKRVPSVDATSVIIALVFFYILFSIVYQEICVSNCELWKTKIQELVVTCNKCVNIEISPYLLTAIFCSASALSSIDYNGKNETIEV